MTLYDCRDMASEYSECVAVRMGSEFACGWCGGSCEVMQECSNTFITEGNTPPPPVINSFTPMSGKNAVSIIDHFYVHTVIVNMLCIQYLHH